MKIEKKPYDKNKSFVNFRSIKRDENYSDSIRKVKIILYDKNKIKSLNNREKIIVKYLKKDLIENKKTDRPKFQLTPNITKEITLLENKDILRYLLHRYRYDIYPLIQKMDDYPPYLQIEPTSFCNFRCVFCFQSNKDFSKRSNGYMGHMKLNTFKRIIDQAEGNVEFISLASRGEPLICRDIEKMLLYTRGKFLNLKINTNASILNERKAHAILQSEVKTLVFSADAADKKLYSKLRVNGKLEKVIANVQLFKKIKDKHYPNAKIITRVSGVKVSKEQKFDDMQKFWGELVDQVAFVDYCPWENVYSSEINTLKKPCSELWRRMYVWWDGKTNPCEVDFKSELTPGDIFKNNISGLWKSMMYQRIRKKHLSKNRKSIEPCSRCYSI
tara:strand:- start:588 stop:1748 length:1161 start_codon:yes stop_codon:yes gene_type:complete